MILNEIKNELENHIVPYWAALRDDEFGGFYGYKSFGLELDRKADKGVILHSRILWFFSECCSVLGGEKYRALADHAYKYVRDCCIDREQGGVFWATTFDGKPSDDRKYTYNIAFAIYALSAYYNATGEKQALELAEKLFEDIETRTPDGRTGHGEAFTRGWKPEDNEELSENGILTKKTMNTVLHLIEAYTELYRMNRSEKVAEALRYQLKIVEDKIFDYDRNALRVFFDDDFNVLGDIHSFGHDIEASWLTDRAVEVLGDSELIKKFNALDLRLAGNIYDIAIDGGALNNERENDRIDTTRVWWVQAEGIVGFVNAYQHSGDEKYLAAAKGIWEYIKQSVIDKREGGEWYSEVTREGIPHDFKEETGPWKCPYHNGRMCLEMIKRGVDF
ncbi:MAG: AGE family epimerase/isomerase [Ruminococcus sp.]|nr:AGE family epimerase/isomerase [Ruminococcus sp.]